MENGTLAGGNMEIYPNSLELGSSMWDPSEANDSVTALASFRWEFESTVPCGFLRGAWRLKELRSVVCHGCKGTSCPSFFTMV